MTITEFRMPSLGADMEDGVVTEWLVGPGDEVHRGQIVVIVETDKSDIEVEVFDDAVVDELLVPEGERVTVGTPIARFLPLGAEVAESTAEPEAQAGPAPAAEHEPAAQSEVEPEPQSEPASEEPVSVPEPEPVLGRSDPEVGHLVTSPLVRRLAESLHVPLDHVRGTGPGGRVHRDDVLLAAVGRPRLTPRARHLAAELGFDASTIAAGDRVITGDDVVSAATATATAPARAVAPAPAREPAPAAAPGSTRSADAGPDPDRRAIAALMTRSWAEIPHFHVATRVDVSEALARLTEVNASRPITGRIIPAALLLHAVAQAATAVPAVNGWWRGGRAERGEHVDLGVVVARRGGGIIAPTIPCAETLTVDEMMAALSDLVGRARSRKLRSSDVGEATLTVTNLGDLGVDTVYGVIHPPQLALVGIGAIHDEVMAIDGLVGARPVLHATLAGDHRALDGLVGASFLARLADAVLESACSIPERQEQS